MRISKQFGWIVIMALLLTLSACVAPTPTPRPTIRIDSPPSNSQVAAGQAVSVQATANDPRGVVRVELQVDGVLVNTADAPGPQTSFSVVLPWKAAGAGNHTISVRSVNQDGVGSEPASIILIVPAETAATSTPVAGPTAMATAAVIVTEAVPTATAEAPTAAPPTATPLPTTPPCRYVATFVSETVRDGTQLLPGQQFNKSWTVRNDGNCAWDQTFALLHVSGERLAPVSGIQVPDTPPGGTAVLTVAMTTPAQPGQHAERWQLRTPQGLFFGPNLSVVIISAAPTPVPCIPTISSFRADRTTINRGESTMLRWGAVTSADRVEIDNGIGGVGTPGERIVVPNQTTTFTLVAYCGGNARSAQVTINVIQPQPTPVPPPTAVPVPQRRNISGMWSAGNYSMQLQEALGCGGPTCGVAGDYSYWTGGTPELAKVSGQFDVYTGAVSLTIVREMPGAPVKTFNGTLSGDSNQLSGTLSDVGQLTFVRQ